MSTTSSSQWNKGSSQRLNRDASGLYMGDQSISNWFDDTDFGDYSDDLFTILERLDYDDEEDSDVAGTVFGSSTTEENPVDVDLFPEPLKASSSSNNNNELNSSIISIHVDSPKRNKRQKVFEEEGGGTRRKRISHITVERNRRKQMNDHLSVLRSLMPCFYVKRGDQASIIGGVVNYITELQQVLQSLEAKKQRKALYSSTTDHHGVLSPRLSKPVPLLTSTATTPNPSPRFNHQLPPISPRTPQPMGSACPSYCRPAKTQLVPPSTMDNILLLHDLNDLVANSKSSVAEVEVKFSGSNLLLKTKSSFRNPAGQVTKIVAALEQLSLEVLQINISTLGNDTTLISSFIIKIGIECQLSAEDLAQQIQQTFCQAPQ